MMRRTTILATSVLLACGGSASPGSTSIGGTFTSTTAADEGASGTDDSASSEDGSSDSIPRTDSKVGPDGTITGVSVRGGRSGDYVKGHPGPEPSDETVKGSGFGILICVAAAASVFCVSLVLNGAGQWRGKER